MIQFRDQGTLDRYVKRVLTAYIDDAERDATKSIDSIAKDTNMSPDAVGSIKMAVRLALATMRAGLILPLPTVPRSDL